MANIVITKKGTNGLHIDFGDYASAELLSPQVYCVNNISHISPEGDGVRVLMEGRDPATWCFTHTAYGEFMIIDSVEGIAPVSKLDLITRLATLM